ncbi:GNAT family N-acetyltransferase [Streptomyces sp. NPDC020965]|uniref:GNAT family N-acetyltransferase n=1 Tax=Streptomyces sp. NPDC020965 TaxID=3365105 RepID=UPI0037A6B7AA
MTTVVPHPVVPLAHSRVRRACDQDAQALHALSRPFADQGALRERPLALYAADAADFLVVASDDGTLAGCLGLRDQAWEPGPPGGVLYNFCVASHSQGRGVGSALLRAALTEAAARSLRAVFTATSGGGELFLRHGFSAVEHRFAPVEWVNALDPRRGSRVLARTIPARRP